MLEQHLEKLNCFYAAAEEKSLVGAATRLGLTQPAVGKSIKMLEAVLKKPLFHRHRRGLDLTSAGESLLAYCEALFLRTRDVEAKILSGAGASGVIRIATYETLGESIWPKALAGLRANYPELKVELSTEERDRVWAKLASGAVDMVVDAEPKGTGDHHSVVLYKDSFGLYSAKNSKLPPHAELIPFSFVRRATDRNGKTIIDHLKSAAVPFNLRYLVDSFTMTRALVKEDLCIGVLPLSLANDPKLEPFKWKGKIINFGDHRICLTTLESRKSEPLISIIRRSLREFGAE